MGEFELSSFASPCDHAAVADLIRRRSGNPVHVWELALGGLDLSGTGNVLDLGCGFGFLTGKVLERVAPNAPVLGIDACKENRAPFLNSVAHTGRNAQFRCMTLKRALPCPSEAYDLVLACYSLYFFVNVLPDIARVLRRDGLFMAITHSETTWKALYGVAGVNANRCPLFALVRCFSAENGPELLGRFFEEVETIAYPNALRFGPEHVEELLHYVRFKLPWLLPQVGHPAEVPEELRKRLVDSLRRDGGFVMEKDDAIFRCRKPRRS
jgi:SAM-dependent methyltransferase